MKKNNKGFTLVELIIIIAVFFVLLMAVVSFIKTSLVKEVDNGWECNVKTCKWEEVKQK